jgi:hypothetical protein
VPICLYSEVGGLDILNLSIVEFICTGFTKRLVFHEGDWSSVSIWWPCTIGLLPCFLGFQNRTLIFAIQEICWEGEYQLNEKMQLVALTFNP